MTLPRRDRRTIHIRETCMSLAVCALSAACSEAPRPAVDRMVDVTGFEYAFQAPDSVDAGPALIQFRNKGRVRHELIFLKLRPGVTISELVAAHKREETFRPFLEGTNAVLFAEPDDDSSIPLFVDFEPGRQYALWCNFIDGTGQPQHASLGMFKVITVRGATPVPGTPRAPNEVVIDASDYAFHLPDTLPAGLTDFRMRNTGNQRHEASFSRLIPGVSGAFLFAEGQKGNNVDSLFDGQDAILTAYPGDVPHVAMRVDLIAGRRYVLVCFFRDAQDQPEHVELGMFKEIVVRDSVRRSN
jgi:hypothetical protein